MTSTPTPLRLGRPAASDLPIAGLARLSTVDWPDKLVATVFVQGCPWRCTYCHNKDLLDCRTPGTVPFAELESLLARRHGLLDGVVFSGGEATRHAAIVPAVEYVRTMGYAVGLHTGGSYPARVARLADTVEWIGYDVKGLPSSYPSVAGAPESIGARAWQCLEGICGRTHRPEIEVRLTVYPGSHSYETVRDCASRARSLGVESFALQQARDADTSRPMSAPGWVMAVATFDELSVAARDGFGPDVIIRAV